MNVEKTDVELTKAANSDVKMEVDKPKSNHDGFISLSKTDRHAEKEVKPAEASAEKLDVKPSESSPEVKEDAEKSKEQTDKKPSKVLKRISELTSKYREKERESEKYKALYNEATQKLSELERPNLANFTGKPEDYVEKLTDYKIRELETEKLKSKVSESEKEATESLVQSFQEAQAEYIKSHPEYEADFAKIPEEVANNGQLGAAIMESNYAVELTHHLAKHPSYALKLNAMSNREQLKEIGRFEQKMELASMTALSNSTVPVMPDVKPVTGSPINNTSKPVEQMTMAEYKQFVSAGGLKSSGKPF